MGRDVFAACGKSQWSRLKEGSRGAAGGGRCGKEGKEGAAPLCATRHLVSFGRRSTAGKAAPAAPGSAAQESGRRPGAILDCCPWACRRSGPGAWRLVQETAALLCCVPLLGLVFNRSPGGAGGRWRGRLGPPAGDGQALAVGRQAPELPAGVFFVRYYYDAELLPCSVE